MKIPCIALLAALALLSVRTPVRAEDKPDDQAADVVLETYDVSDLIAEPIDYPGPSASLRGGAAVVDPFAGAPVARRTLTAPDIVTLLHDRLLAADFAEPTTSIAENNGTLVAMAHKTTHIRIAHCLADLRHTQKIQVSVKALLVPMADVPAETLFDAAALAKLLGSPGPAAAVAAPHLVCQNGQLTHIRSGKMFNYVRDYDVAGGLYEPVISSALEGCVMEVRPGVSGDGASVSMMFRFTYAMRTGKMQTRSIVLAPPVKAVEPLKNEEIKIGDAPSGGIVLPIDVPAMNIQSVNTDLRIPQGKWVLAGVMNNPDMDAKEKRLALLVTAETITVSPAPPPLPPLPAVKFQARPANGAGAVVAPDPNASQSKHGARAGAGADEGSTGAKKGKDEF